MSAGHAKKSSLSFDKFLTDKLKPAVFGFVGLLHKIAILAVFFGLIGYVLASLKAEGFNPVRDIFQGASFNSLEK